MMAELPISATGLGALFLLPAVLLQQAQDRRTFRPPFYGHSLHPELQQQVQQATEPCSPNKAKLDWLGC